MVRVEKVFADRSEYRFVRGRLKEPLQGEHFVGQGGSAYPDREERRQEAEGGQAMLHHHQSRKEHIPVHLRFLPRADGMVRADPAGYGCREHLLWSCNRSFQYLRWSCEHKAYLQLYLNAVSDQGDVDQNLASSQGDLIWPVWRDSDV